MAAQRLSTLDAETLLLTPLEKPPFVIEDFLPAGLHLFCGAPKVGKSWLMLDLAISVTLGLPFWGYATRACDVLYLCLEDTHHRIQQRLFKLTDIASPRLHFAIAAHTLDEGLICQLDEFICSHTGTKLIILDTLQVVRSISRDRAYAADYADLTRIKRFADENALAVLVIHHTRKLPDGDVFNTVSGTTGITGCADSTFILSKESRHDNNALLRVSGRDVEYQEFKLRFRDCRWELVEKTSIEELAERSIPEVIMQVVAFLEHQREWQGTASELAAALNAEGITPNTLAKSLNQHHGFLNERGIAYTSGRNRDARFIRLALAESRDDRDGGDDE